MRLFGIGYDEDLGVLNQPGITQLSVNIGNAYGRANFLGVELRYPVELICISTQWRPVYASFRF